MPNGDYKNHHFMPGMTVKVDGKIGQVFERGAHPNTYFVKVKFLDNKIRTYINEDILKIKNH